MHTCYTLFVILIMALATAMSGWAQISAQDSAAIQTDTTVTQTPQYQETILEPIRIEAVIEMPRVALIPKKVETEMGKLEFGYRSFDKELRSKPKVITSVLEELESAKKISRLKKTLAKKRK